MSEKPDRDRLVEETARYLVSYVGRVASIRRFLDGLDPMVRIEGLTELLEYRFLRTGNLGSEGLTDRAELDLDARETAGITDGEGEPVGVLDFVALLPHRLRSLEPTVRQRLDTFEGEVRGHVDWNRTVKRRRATGDVRGQSFVCRVPNRSVVTSRNKVLVELLATIKRVYERFDRNFTGDDESDRPGWFSEWAPGARARRIVRSALENAHLDNFDAESVSVSDRELAAVLGDRNPLYREAAALLEDYRRITGGDLREEDAKRLLSMEVFEPDDDDVTNPDLFELYWIFRIVDEFENSRLRQIDAKGREEFVAAWEGGGKEYLLFNDWKGTHQWTDDDEEREYVEITLPEYPDGEAYPSDDDPRPTLRSGYLLRYTQQIRAEAFDYDADRKYPDIALLRLDTTAEQATLEKLFLAEVKHSVGRGRLREKAQQLLTYGCYAKVGEDLRIDRDADSEFVASDPDVVASPEVELGYFVGASESVEDVELDGIQVKGFGDDPELPFAD
ncbi:hypothetical protein [Halorussus caseinilyticus]|uniref:hypothetical protein n=1 Tax=Halorussus caseinilyticus TaxID=3034025 RepID=UPI0023E8F61F|nr:hypothetical protein [Halorussus sp. DT72]